jgi:hypothetical protein
MKLPGKGMQKKIICGLIFLMLLAVPVHGENAMDTFNLGVKSTVTRTKIKCFTKALELDPNLAEAYRLSGKYEEAASDFSLPILPQNRVKSVKEGHTF